MLKKASALSLGLLLFATPAHATIGGGNSGGGGTAAPGGSNGQFQYNNNGSFGGLTSIPSTSVSGLGTAATKNVTGSGAAIPTGPASSTAGNIVTYSSTAGQQVDGGIPIASLQSATYTITTSGTLAIPSWAKTMDYAILGGPGSGGNGIAVASGTSCSGGAAGGTGEYLEKKNFPVTQLASPLTITIGAPGAAPTAGVSGAAGSSGGDSSIRDAGSWIVTAHGGGPGQAGQSNAGNTGGSGGNLAFAGASTGNGYYGAGGGGYPTGSQGGQATAPGSGAGGGSCGNGAAGGAGGFNQVDLNVPTAGGGGGGVNSSGVGQNGGASSNLPANSTFAGGTAPGGNGSVIPSRTYPGMTPIGAPGGAGGNATTNGGNASAPSGPGAPGGGGGCTLTPNTVGNGSGGNAPVAYVTFHP